jgi:hypothetical protein
MVALTCTIFTSLVWAITINQYLKDLKWNKSIHYSKLCAMLDVKSFRTTRVSCSSCVYVLGCRPYPWCKPTNDGARKNDRSSSFFFFHIYRATRIEDIFFVCWRRSQGPSARVVSQRLDKNSNKKNISSSLDLMSSRWEKWMNMQQHTLANQRERDADVAVRANERLASNVVLRKARPYTIRTS